MDYLTVCAITKDEDAYVREWLAFQFLVGVERVVLYNNGERAALSRDAADGLPWERIEQIDAPGPEAQVPAYADAIARLRGRSRWVAFIDLDEFLFPSRTDDLRIALEEFEPYAGVGVNWVCFGSGGRVHRPDGLVLESYLDRGPIEHVVPYPHLWKGDGPRNDLRSYRAMNSHVKSIVDPSAVVSPASPHHFAFQEGSGAVSEKREVLDGPWTESVSVDSLRINHYWSKSYEEMQAKVNKGRPDTMARRSMVEAVVRDIAASGVRDEEILRFGSAVRAMLS